MKPKDNKKKREDKEFSNELDDEDAEMLKIDDLYVAM